MSENFLKNAWRETASMETPLAVLNIRWKKKKKGRNVFLDTIYIRPFSTISTFFTFLRMSFTLLTESCIPITIFLYFPWNIF